MVKAPEFQLRSRAFNARQAAIVGVQHEEPTHFRPTVGPTTSPQPQGRWRVITPSTRVRTPFRTQDTPYHVLGRNNR